MLVCYLAWFWPRQLSLFKQCTDIAWGTAHAILSKQYKQERTIPSTWTGLQHEPVRVFFQRALYAFISHPKYVKTASVSFHKLSTSVGYNASLALLQCPGLGGPSSRSEICLGPQTCSRGDPSLQSGHIQATLLGPCTFSSCLFLPQPLFAHTCCRY